MDLTDSKRGFVKVIGCARCRAYLARHPEIVSVARSADHLHDYMRGGYHKRGHAPKARAR